MYTIKIRLKDGKYYTVLEDDTISLQNPCTKQKKLFDDRISIYQYINYWEDKAYEYAKYIVNIKEDITRRIVYSYVNDICKDTVLVHCINNKLNENHDELIESKYIDYVVEKI